MYFKHMFSWILRYHGRHIVQNISKHVKVCQNSNIALFCNNIRIQSMYAECVLPKIGTFKLQEWEIGEFANYVTYTILLISFIFNIFLFCYIGELVAEQV